MKIASARNSKSKLLTLALTKGNWEFLGYLSLFNKNFIVDI